MEDTLDIKRFEQGRACLERASQHYREATQILDQTLLRARDVCRAARSAKPCVGALKIVLLLPMVMRALESNSASQSTPGHSKAVGDKLAILHWYESAAH